MQNYARQHQETLRFVTDAIPALISFVDAEGRYAFVNEAYSHWLGLAPDSLCGRPQREALGPAAYEEIRPHVERALAGERVEFRTKIRHPGGGRRVVNGHYIPRFAADGSLLGFVGVIFDITSRAEAEAHVRALNAGQERILAELRAGIAKHRRMEVRQRTLFELSQALSAAAVPREVAQVAVTRARTALGAAAATVYQLPEGADVAQLVAGECMGKPITSWQAIPLDAPLPLMTAMRTRTPLWIPDRAMLDETFPALGHRPGIPPEHVQAVAAVPLLSGGQLIGGLAFSFSEPHELEPREREFILVVAEQCANAFARAGMLEKERGLRQKVESYAQRLASEAELRERYVGVLAHDLRGPLGSISSAARLLARRGAFASEDLTVLSRIARSATRMHRMIEQLLDFTRIRHGGGFRLDPKPMDLGALAGDIVAELRAAHPEADLRCDVVGDCCGEWDADRLGQVVSNLVANAVRHGSGAAIRARVEGAGPEVSLAVHNQGAVIPDELLPHLFEPFRSGATQAAREGLGLGLYITREIVEAHGGGITVSSSVEGTSFKVCLPRRAPAVVGCPVPAA